MKFTIEVERDSEHSNQWVSTCKELDVISAAMSPGEALEAVAEAVRIGGYMTPEDQRVLWRARSLSRGGR
jgi:hypothetical protein